MLVGNFSSTDWLNENVKYFTMYQLHRLSTSKWALGVELEQDELSVENSWHGTDVQQLHHEALVWLQSNSEICEKTHEPDPTKEFNANDQNNQNQPEANHESKTKNIAFEAEPWLLLHLPLIETFTVQRETNGTWSSNPFHKTWTLSLTLKVKSGMKIAKQFSGQTYDQCKKDMDQWLQHRIGIQYTTSASTFTSTSSTSSS